MKNPCVLPTKLTLPLVSIVVKKDACAEPSAALNCWIFAGGLYPSGSVSTTFADVASEKITYPLTDTILPCLRYRIVLFLIPLGNVGIIQPLSVRVVDSLALAAVAQTEMSLEST